MRLPAIGFPGRRPRASKMQERKPRPCFVNSSYNRRPLGPRPTHSEARTDGVSVELDQNVLDSSVGE
jgi:hypothetical protein